MSGATYERGTPLSQVERGIVERFFGDDEYTPTTRLCGMPCVVFEETSL